MGRSVLHGSHDIDDEARRPDHFGAEQLAGGFQEGLCEEKFLRVVVFRFAIVSPDGSVPLSGDVAPSAAYILKV
jgi:hypothetical protein